MHKVGQEIEAVWATGYGGCPNYLWKDSQAAWVLPPIINYWKKFPSLIKKERKVYTVGSCRSKVLTFFFHNIRWNDTGNNEVHILLQSTMNPLTSTTHLKVANRIMARVWLDWGQKVGLDLYQVEDIHHHEPSDQHYSSHGFQCGKEGNT